MQAEERVRTRPHLAAGDRSGRLWALDNKVNELGLGAVQITLGDTPRGKAKVLAQITRGGDRDFTVKAHGLFAKVTVNGAATRQKRLEPGDRIEIEGVPMRFFLGLQDREAS